MPCTWILNIITIITFTIIIIVITITIITIITIIIITILRSRTKQMSQQLRQPSVFPAFTSIILWLSVVLLVIEKISRSLIINTVIMKTFKSILIIAITIIIYILSAAAAGMIAFINWTTRKCVRVKRSPTSIQRESLEIVGDLPPINSKWRSRKWEALAWFLIIGYSEFMNLSIKSQYYLGHFENILVLIPTGFAV